MGWFGAGIGLQELQDPDFDDFEPKNGSKKVYFCSTDFLAWSPVGGLLVGILNKVLLDGIGVLK